ncbi:MAG: DUF3817 domain-containing protein [Actinomycetota bacterium]|nr:MAG: DUF3817 domain-containing protein [Actinomycetota bacterium]
MRGALLRYRVMAWLTGVVLAVMTLALCYSLTVSSLRETGLYSVGWVAHGWLFVVYVVTALDLGFRLRWPLWRLILVALAGTVPFASFFAERWVSHRVEAQLAEASSRAPATSG